MKISNLLKIKWLWPLWFVLVCTLLIMSWHEVMATKCSTVWSPNKQFKVEYYFYGYVPIFDSFIIKMNGFKSSGFTKITDKDGRVIERRDERDMSSICNRCILLQPQARRDKDQLEREGCTGNETPYEAVGSISGSGGGGDVVWSGLHRNDSKNWKVYWRNLRNWYFLPSYGDDVTTLLPAPPED